MKPIIIALVVLILLLQYELWFSQGGLITMWRLKHNIIQQKVINKQLKQRNAALIADINDLKHGNQAIEERARNELGMVKKGEVFYQIVPSDSR